MPFARPTFDLCMARVSIMYMNMPAFFQEAERVLRPGGDVWFTCHDLHHVTDHLLRSLRALRFKDVLFRLYVLANGTLLHAFGAQLHSDVIPALNETYQTRRGLRICLERAGFVDVRFPPTNSGHFLVVARKPISRHQQRGNAMHDKGEWETRPSVANTSRVASARSGYGRAI